jgi:peptide deformylase
MELRLTLYPTPVLRKVAEPVDAFDESLAETVAAMEQVMTEANGVGLAAPQVGLRKRILILNPTGEPADALTLVNARILERSGPESTYEEGCLSFPGIYAEVVRPELCRVSAYAVDGTPIEEEYDGFTSRIIQHEYDHLEGVLLVDRMSPADKQRHRAALEELVEDYRAANPAKAGAGNRRR